MNRRTAISLGKRKYYKRYRYQYGYRFAPTGALQRAGRYKPELDWKYIPATITIDDVRMKDFAQLIKEKIEAISFRWL